MQSASWHGLLTAGFVEAAAALTSSGVRPRIKFVLAAEQCVRLPCSLAWPRGCKLPKRVWGLRTPSRRLAGLHFGLQRPLTDSLQLSLCTCSIDLLCPSLRWWRLIDLLLPNERFHVATAEMAPLGCF